MVANAALPIKCVTAEEREEPALREGKKRDVARQFEATPPNPPTPGWHVVDNQNPEKIGSRLYAQVGGVSGT